MSDSSYAPATRSVGPADRVVTVLLMLGLAVLVFIGSVFGLLTAMASDGCTTDTCNDTLIGVGVFTSAGAPVVAFLVALVWMIVRWARGRRTWWVPLAGLVLGIAGWFAGAMITFSAVG
ncbi:hypothetical protein KDN32_06250 [Nocardioides sp. J2M5]|uniref:DUF6264 family protein n=1 Tax=Nocardioides palaemonis TaxID=2829810 RepID=UPI001BA66551|nr:DUF6264 family protein [Nocardioides palaemonis]MBS2937339.1 hypothetical protein [Nocardioides palaemonis]